MKLIHMTLATIAFFSFSLTTVHAGDRQVGGLLIGGGTGALIGQAVGQNTESTLVGATVGGVVGLIIGSELDRNHGAVSHNTHVVTHYNRYDNRRYDRRPRPVFRDRHRYNHYRDYPRYRGYRGDCKKVVTIKEGRHRSKRIVSTVCRNDSRDYKRNHKRFRYNNGYYR
ncbi:MAG: YMGG-like glycine zipper-containing protein [Desulforhopalus sp.]